MENSDTGHQIEHLLPAEIERQSFAIIRQELKEQGVILPKQEAPVILRCIHTSADFDYASNLRFSKDAVLRGLDAIRRGTSIVTDTQMARAGINKKALAQFGGQVYCFMSDTDVAQAAKREGTTRASVSMEKAGRLDEPLIFAVGNAPTALLRLYQMIRDGRLRPELIIAAPVGFVNVVAAKERILELDVPYIVAGGRKGGSGIAACICNALLYQLQEQKAENAANHEQEQKVWK